MWALKSLRGQGPQAVLLLADVLCFFYSVFLSYNGPVQLKNLDVILVKVLLQHKRQGKLTHLCVSEQEALTFKG